MKQEYNEEINLEQGLDLGLKTLIKTMDTATPSAKKSNYKKFCVIKINKTIKFAKLTMNRKLNMIFISYVILKIIIKNLYVN